MFRSLSRRRRRKAKGDFFIFLESRNECKEKLWVKFYFCVFVFLLSIRKIISVDTNYWLEPKFSPLAAFRNCPFSFSCQSIWAINWTVTELVFLAPQKAYARGEILVLFARCGRKIYWNLSRNNYTTGELRADSSFTFNHGSSCWGPLEGRQKKGLFLLLGSPNNHFCRNYF